MAHVFDSCKVIHKKFTVLCIYCIKKIYREPKNASMQERKNERMIKSVEPLSRHQKISSSTQRNTYTSFKSSAATKTENTSGLTVGSRDLQMTRSYTSSWRSPLRLFVPFLQTFYSFFSVTAISLHFRAAGQDLIWDLRFLISEGNFSNLGVMR